LTNNRLVFHKYTTLSVITCVQISESQEQFVICILRNFIFSIKCVISVTTKEF